MTFFGVIWLMILLIAFILPKINVLFFLTILSSTLQCSNVIIIGEIGIGPQVITSAAFILKILLEQKGLCIKIRRSVIALQLSVLAMFIIILVSSIYNHTLAEKVTRVLQLLIYICCYFAMYEASEKLEPSFIYNTIRRITAFLLVVGFIQVLMTTGVLPRFLLVTELLYNDTISGSIYFTKDNYFRILSTYMEPSYYAGFIVGAFYYFLSFKEKRKENIFLLIFMVIEIILTFSSTAYAAFAVVGLLFVFFSQEGKMKITVLICGILGIAVMYYGFYNVLDQVLFSKMSSGSGIARFYWNKAALRNFYSSPIIGIGYKQGRASSLIYTLLAELGVIGLAGYIIMNILFLKPLFTKNNHNRYSNESIAFRFALVGVIVCQIIAIPDLDICSYWMWLNFLAVSSSFEKTVSSKNYYI